MFRLLLPLFTIVPLLDLLLLLWIGERIGLWPSLALVIGTGILGAALAKREGLRVLRRWQEALAERRMPEEGLLSGVLVLVGATLLVAPGVATDLAGILLLLPPTRRLAARGVRRFLERRVTVFVGGTSRGPRRARDRTIEVESRPSRDER